MPCKLYCYVSYRIVSYHIVSILIFNCTFSKYNNNNNNNNNSISCLHKQFFCEYRCVRKLTFYYLYCISCRITTRKCFPTYLTINSIMAADVKCLEHPTLKVSVKMSFGLSVRCRAIILTFVSDVFNLGTCESEIFVRIESRIGGYDSNSNRISNRIRV